MFENYPRQTREQLEQVIGEMSAAFACAYAEDCGTGKVIGHEVEPTEFDIECRWHIEHINNEKHIINTAHKNYYYQLTSIPPDQAMLSLTVDGDTVELVFVPKVTTSKSSKGFGK